MPCGTGSRKDVYEAGDQPELLLIKEQPANFGKFTFTTTLGFSSLVYAEIFPMKTSTFYYRHKVHALSYYGAVPAPCPGQSENSCYQA